jgi:ketosteroid isomerase-like protein
MSQRLPVRPNLDQLKRHAKTVLRLARADRRNWRLADAQRAIALGFGFSSWSDLKRQVLAAPSASASNGPSSMTEPPRASSREETALAGIWICEGEIRTTLGIELTEGAIVLTQLTEDGTGRPIANTLVLNDNGEERPLPHRDDLTIRAHWRDARSLCTTVRRGGHTVAEGTYTVASDGRTLSTETGSLRHVFTRLMAVAAIAVMAAGGCAARSDAHRRAIEALNQHDIKAALSSDVDAVISQWSDGFTQITAAGAVIRGRAANVALVMQARDQIALFEPMAYTVDFEEITVSGDYAYAWGSYRTTARQKKDGAEIKSSGKLLRIYQRQRDGRWLMHRTMSTIDVKPK